MFDSVRMRLTLWYVGVLGIVLIVLSTGVYIVVKHSLYGRMDAALRSTLEMTTASLVRHAASPAATSEGVVKVLEELHSPNQAIAVWGDTGRLIAERPAAGNIHVRLPSSGVSPTDTISFYSLPEQRDDSDDSCRGAVQRVRLAAAGTVYLVVVNQSLELVSDQLELLQDILFLGVPLTLALAGFGGWLLARRSLAAVVQMSERAQRISAENLEQRLPVANPRDELGGLATTFNDLLTRLSNAFAQQRQFVADASHELRTPLSIMRTTAQVTLEPSHRQENEYREALTVVDQQTRRLTRIVEDMLVLARADAAYPNLQEDNLYLDELVAETARDAAALAERKGVRVNLPVFANAPFLGDEKLLRQMILNLLDNAIKYTPKGGVVHVGLEARAAAYLITVSDNGPGIPVEAQPHIFERFYRADKARSGVQNGHEGGSGLGLAIARWIAQAHHGRLELQRSDQVGSTFVVLLPRV